jgi:hypothetical protein
MKEVKPKAGGVKRGADEISEGVQNLSVEEEKKDTRGKGVKRSKTTFEVSNEELKTMLAKGLMEKQTVQWMKEVLEERGVETKARAKAKLIDEISTWVSNNS